MYKLTLLTNFPSGIKQPTAVDMRASFSRRTGLVFLLLILTLLNLGLKSQCSSSTPSFTLDLSGNPNASSVTPSASRNGTCCNGSIPCVKIVVLLNPNAMALMLVPTGADPGGALTYEFNCNGIQIPGGTPVCLSGTGPQTLTICKVGNNANSYSVVSIAKPSVPDSVLVRNGCTQTLVATGFSVPTIQWGAINSGTNTSLFNSYLSCTSGCATVVVAPTGTVPVAFIDYTVSGTGQAPCETNFYMDTVRVFFFNDLAAIITPSNPVICFGAPNPVLTATATGGLGPYTYTWSTGPNTSTVSVGPGTYTVLVNDRTNCPGTSTTVTVLSFSMPITALPGPAQTLCKSSPVITLSGSVTGVSTGSWSGGGGTFAPSNTALATTYSPTAAEVIAGSVQLTLTTTNNLGCPSSSSVVTVQFQNNPTITAGPDVTVCANNAVSNFTASITGYTSSPVWSTLGSGTFSSLTSAANAYTPSAGDISTGSVNIVVTSTNNGACPPARDTLKILFTPKPNVSAGSNQTICSNSSAPLGGTVMAGAITGSWSTSGDGTFNPNITSFTSSYTPGPLDIFTGSVSIFLTSTGNGNCLSVRDTMIIYVRRQATVNAGPNQMVCTTTPSIVLSGTVTGATTTGSWSTGGSGGFSPGSNVPNPNYAITAGDITIGFVTFTLTSTNNGPCPAVSDSLRINVQQPAQVSAGPNLAWCTNQNTLTLTGGIFTSPGTGTWSSNGTGSIGTPSNLTNSYTFTPADITAGQVTFTLTSTNNGACPAVRDTVTMRIVKQATVNAGANTALCSTGSSIALTGTVSGVSGQGTWLSPGSGTIANPTSLNTSYQVNSNDYLSGTLVFTLQSSNNGPCPIVNDTVRVRFVQLASVNAGTIQPICATQNTISLAGAITGVNGLGTWTTSGNGGILNPGNLFTSYSVTPGDINLGTVVFTLSSINNGPCPVVSDTVMARIVKTATVNAGTNQSICSNTNVISLNGTVNGASGTGQWQSNGTGVFTPGNFMLNTTYNIVSSDITNGSVIFTLTSTGNGPCPQVNDTVRVEITTLATVNSGPNQVLCSGTKTIALNGSISGSSFTGSWTASGSGSFAPSNINLVSTYSFAVDDIQTGYVTLTLTSTNNKGCPAVMDTVRMRIMAQPTANAGPDFTVCSTQQAVALQGNVTGISNTGLWTTLGTGSFSPSNTSLGGLYSIAGSDISKGFVTLYLNSTNNGICPGALDSMRIKIITYPKITMQTDTTICQNQRPFRVAGSIIGGSGGLEWITNGTGTFTPNNYSNPTFYLFGAGDLQIENIVISLKSINNGPCGDVSNKTTIHILPTPKAAFSASQYTLTIPSPPLAFINETKGGKSYRWTFEDGKTSTATNPSYNFSVTGFYTVQLVATNEQLCRDTTTRVITVISDIVFPNAFTPNPNGSNGGYYNKNDFANSLNDVFFPYTGGVTEYQLMIFNRWGELLFQSQDINIGWDGYFKGNLCQQDAYVWKANVKFFDGRTFFQTGSVTLLR